MWINCTLINWLLILRKSKQAYFLSWEFIMTLISVLDWDTQLIIQWLSDSNWLKGLKTAISQCLKLFAALWNLKVVQQHGLIVALRVTLSTCLYSYSPLMTPQLNIGLVGLQWLEATQSQAETNAIRLCQVCILIWLVTLITSWTI